MTRLGRAAAAYAKLGLRVFPLRPKGKEPSHLVAPSAPGAGDGGFHKATTDQGQIAAWWLAEPEANIGIATGQGSKILVLDVDVKDADGFATLAGVLKAAGGPLINTPWQETGLYERGRGRQYFFAWPEGLDIRCSTGKLGHGLDIRTDGGYVVAAPSLHPSGVAYQWDAEAHPTKIPFEPVPEWLSVPLVPRTPSEPPHHVDRPAWDTVPPNYVRAAVDGEHDAVAKAAPGTRNAALNRAAFNLGQLVGAGSLSRAVAEQTLTAAASENGYLAEEGPAHVAAVIKSGLEKGMAEPRQPPAPPPPPPRKGGKSKPQLRVVSQEDASNEDEENIVGDDWRSQPVVDTHGKLKRASFHNAVITLTQALGADGVAFDDFTTQVMLMARPPWAVNGFEPRPVRDVDATAAANWLDANGISVTAKQAFEALLLLADENHVNPVRDALTAYRWDGTARLDHWLCDFMHAPDNSFVRAAGAKWLIGAVARIMNPGAKVDTMLILEGRQGLKKSMALAELAVFAGRSYFTDDLHALGSKDAALQLHGNVIVELAELDALERAEVKQIKAFLSRQIDKFRKPYGRVVEPSPRQCVFAGTVNPDGTDYLHDPTGGRRFWPVPVSHIDTVGLRLVREQLWAEAYHRYREGEAWWLEDSVLQEEAVRAQEERQEEDPLTAKLAKWLKTQREVTTDLILADCWSLPSHQFTRGMSQRAGRIMKKLGWHRVQIRDGYERRRVYRPANAQREMPLDDEA